MKNTRSLPQQRHRRSIKYVALTTAIFLIASSVAAQDTKPSIAPPGPQDLTKFPGLLAEFGPLMEKIEHGVQFPPQRGESRLLPLLPESTVFYAAFPNYGDASHQALTIFREELKQRPVLRDWWQHGSMSAEGPKIEDALEKFYRFSQFLGDEIVVAGGIEMPLASEPGAPKDPHVLILAEVRKPGLKTFLQESVKELAGKSEPGVRVFDVKELAAARNTSPEKQLVILVRPDFVVAALDVGELRSFSARLDRNGREFASTPFGQRLALAYLGGATAVGGADVQKILKLVPQGTDQSQLLLRRSGFADMKYLVWEHKSVAGQTASQTELSFTGPRRGVASWLAAPGPMGSLDFVSPKAVMASTVLLKSPADIFDDVKDLAAASNPNALASLAQMEQGLKLSLKDDLLGRLGGEITFELDSLAQPDPVWKAILKVNDADRLQATLNTLLATAPVTAKQIEEGGITYHTLQIPSADKPREIGYAFVDGYLVVASSRETVAEAIRLHRSGDNLGKSPKFLAALPPGRLSQASAVLYQDPTAFAALSMRQVSPEMAELFSHTTTETAPTLIAGYGEESALRAASRSGGVDAGAVLVVAAIAIPNLLRARIAANEASAVANIRTVNVAQIMYMSSYPEKGFARDLATLGPDPSGARTPSAAYAGLIDATLANASCTAGNWCSKSGFQFTLTAVCEKQPCVDFVVVGTPVSSNSGTRSFCSTSDAVVRFKLGPPLDSPVTVAECQLWPPLQ
jgi:type II secretory pathway pseudopilin PulG